MATALITGASRGLGLALTRGLVEAGWRVIVDARDGGLLHAAIAELAPSVVAVGGDVADPSHRAALVRAVVREGPLDALVHNASVLGPSPQPPLITYPIEVLRGVYEVNVIAPIALTQALAPHLRDGAAVVAVTSDAAVEAYEGWGGYGSSKAALEHAFAVLAEEHPAWRVLRVDPGDMRTDMHAAAFPGEDLSHLPPPDISVPGLIALLTGEHPSGRYHARDLAALEVA